MRTALAASLAAVVTAGLLAGSASAAPPEMAPPDRLPAAVPPHAAAPHQPIRNRQAELLKQYDANGNGRIDHEEREALREALRARMEALRATIEAETAPGSSSAARLEEKMIARGRELLSADEGRAVLAPDAAARTPQAAGAPQDAALSWLMQGLLARYDTNRNGKLDADERRAMRAAAR